MEYVRTLRIVTLLLLVWWSALAQTAKADPMRANQAFRLWVLLDDEQNLELNLSIAPWHYIYRERVSAKLDGKAVDVTLPHGEVKDDPTFGPTEIFRQQLTGLVSGHSLPVTGRLHVTFQGCRENLICYPPVTEIVDLVTLEVSHASDLDDEPAARSSANERGSTDAGADTQSLFGAPRLDGNLATTVLAFLGLGVLLSLTPCVLPMVPILSGMITRSGRSSIGRSFSLSATYVLAMASAYAVVGIFAAWSGDNLQALLQTPIAIGLMSLLFIGLALSMFDLFDLRLPSSWSARVGNASAASGSLGGAAILGFTSALVVGPCVTPPFAAALIYVAQTGDTLRGASALFALGLGMGVPLLAFGTFGPRILPRSGPWLARIKQVFGFVFIGLAIWIASRVLATPIVVVAWSLVFMSFGIWIALAGGYRWHWTATGLARQTIGALFAAYGLTLLFGVRAGFHEISEPLMAAGLVQVDAEQAPVEHEFQVVTNERDLSKAIIDGDDRPVLIDFTAEWCSECKVMEKTVLADATVRRQLAGLRRVRIDMTHNDAFSRRLMRRFSVVGPPTMIFVSGTGREIDGTRIVGRVDVGEFLEKMNKARRG